MRSEGNRIYFSGDVGGDPLPTVAALHDIIKRQDYSDVVLDFRDARTLWPGYMLPLVTTCRAYRQDRVDFELLVPDDRKVAGLMINTNWANLILPEKFDEQVKKDNKHMPARRFISGDEHFDAVDASLELILSLVPGIDRNRIKALEWALNEITDNVLNHSQSPLGGIMQVVSFPNRRRLDFFVCDAGITIPKSLRPSRPDIHDDTSALRAAIDEGVTRNKQTNQGNGLFGTFKCCEVSGGEFEILSGYVNLKHKPGQLHVSKNAIPFSGTYVRASIAYEFDRLLEKALIFQGRPHDPRHDYIERKYQVNNDRLTFTIGTELTAFGSREAGRVARNKIETLMNNQSTAIDFDFDGIHLISSSFADEVFGKLFAELGAIKFTQLCRFNNVDSTVQGLIDRAISQRMRI